MNKQSTMRSLWPQFSAGKRVPAGAEPFEDGVVARQRGDYAKAVNFFRPLAKARYRLGLMYDNGLGLPHDNADAQNEPGVMYDTGESVPKDEAEAVNSYRTAVEQGVASAQNCLGFLYANGEGVPQDYAEAVKWFRLAAEQGDADAQSNLGVMYGNGDGVRGPS